MSNRLPFPDLKCANLMVSGNWQVKVCRIDNVCVCVCVCVYVCMYVAPVFEYQ